MVEVGTVGNSGRPASRKFHAIPANPWYVALYFNHIDDPFVALVLKGCERLCAQPTTKKDPVTVSVVKDLVDHYGPLAQLSDLRVFRFLVIVVVSFAGFFRIDEMLTIRLQHAHICDGHMRIILPQCKNDQMRKGNEILIARTHSRYCPVGLTEMFWRKAEMDRNHSETFFIPRLLATKGGHVALKSHGISYTTAYEQFSLYPAGDRKWGTIHTSQPEIRRRLASRSKRGGGTTYLQTWSVEVGPGQERIHRGHHCDSACSEPGVSLVISLRLSSHTGNYPCFFTAR